MKKLVSVLLIAVILMSAMSVTVFATDYTVDDLFKDQLFYERFIEEYSYSTFYYEEYYHHVDETDENSDIDWVLISAATDVMCEPIENPPTNYYIIDDIVYGSIYYYQPFETPYCVYDVIQDEFLDIRKIDFDDYKGLRDVFCSDKYGLLIGDIDSDNDVTILDATEIQLILAKLKEQYVIIGVSDFDRDGELTVMDVTAIQFKLAKVEEQPVVNEEMVFSDYSQRLSSMPRNAIPLFFNIEYDKKQVSNYIYKSGKFPHSCNSVVIIKSNEQYREMFNEDAPVFDDKFFETKCLVASMVFTYGMNGSAAVMGVSKYGDTLYVQALSFKPSGLLEPFQAFWLTMVSVDKKFVSDVYNVVEVYGY